MVSRFDFNNEANDKRKGVGNKQKEQPSKKKTKNSSLAKGKKEKDTQKKSGTIIFPRRNEISFRIILYAILVFIALYLVFCVYKYVNSKNI